MPDHVCPHEQDFGTVKESLRKIDKDLYGNGEKGIVPRFIIMETEHITVMGNLEKLATSYSALSKSQITMDATEKLKAENKKRIATAIEKIATIVGVGISLVGLLYVVLEHL